MRTIEIDEQIVRFYPLLKIQSSFLFPQMPLLQLANMVLPYLRKQKVLWVTLPVTTIITIIVVGQSRQAVTRYMQTKAFRNTLVLLTSGRFCPYSFCMFAFVQTLLLSHGSSKTFSRTANLRFHLWSKHKELTWSNTLLARVHALLLWISDPDMFLNPNNSAPYFSGSSFDILWFQFAMWPRFFVHVRRPSLFFHIRIPSLWSSKFDYLYTKCKKTEMRFSKQNLRNFFFSKSFFFVKSVIYVIQTFEKSVYLQNSKNRSPKYFAKFKIFSVMSFNQTVELLCVGA